jgi:predicted enzyme related to lactoylglutathione lyase
MTREEASPLFQKIDALQIPVPDLDAGLSVYRDRLGHELIWRTATAAGLRMPGTDAELVLQTERKELETNLVVASADAAAARMREAGGGVVVPPFDIPIGRCAVVADPWGNRLVLLDGSKGVLVTGADGAVQLDAAGRPRVTPRPA